MTASSQNPSGALPPEGPLPGLYPAHSAFGVAHPFVSAPGAFPWPPAAAQEEMPAAPGVSPVRAAAALLDAELDRAIETGAAVTGESLAKVEESAGILFDPQRAEEIAAATRAQVRDEYAADIAERGRQLAMLSDQNRALREGQGDRDGLKASLDAVLRLIEGRPLTDHLPVQAILDAAAHGATPYDSAPMTLAWDSGRGVELPDDGSFEGQAIVPCTSVYGGRADLVLDAGQRQALANLLDLQVRDINTPCETPGCGEAADAELSDLFGWSRLEIASLNHGPRWYCCDMCVVDALARAGHELAAADRQAEQGGDL